MLVTYELGKKTLDMISSYLDNNGEKKSSNRPAFCPSVSHSVDLSLCKGECPVSGCPQTTFHEE